MSRGEIAAAEMPGVEMIAHIGLDVLNLLTEGFRQKMGRQFERIWEQCLSETHGFDWEIFHDIRPDADNVDMNITIIKSRYKQIEGAKDEKMLLEGFLDVTKRVCTAVKSYLGEGAVNDTVQKAVEMLSMIGKYQRDPVITEAFVSGLRDS
jgi:hypothetical protein